MSLYPPESRPQVSEPPRFCDDILGWPESPRRCPWPAVGAFTSGGSIGYRYLCEKHSAGQRPYVEPPPPADSALQEPWFRAEVRAGKRHFAITIPDGADVPLDAFERVYRAIAEVDPALPSALPQEPRDVGLQCFLTAIIEQHGSNSHVWLTHCARELLAHLQADHASRGGGAIENTDDQGLLGCTAPGNPDGPPSTSMPLWPIDDQWREMRRECISRLEIIDESGRAYTRHELYIDLISVQDNGRTLKLFVRPRRGSYQMPGEAPRLRRQHGMTNQATPDPSTPSPLPSSPHEGLITAAEQADWVQVVLNGGPPCFRLMNEGGGERRLCLRAERWLGHGTDDRIHDHAFVSLADLLRDAALALQAAAQRAQTLRDGLRAYGYHRASCAVFTHGPEGRIPSGKPCTCGLAALLGDPA